MQALTRLLPAAALFAITLPALAQGDALTAKLLNIQHQWAHINYQLPKDAKEDALGKLETETDALAKAYPQRAEPKIWEAIVLSTHAGVHGGFGALSMVRKARSMLITAKTIDPNALNGSIYTSLGTLYYQVPGWPLGFGNDKKADAYLKKALQLNPNGIDPNYFYGDFLYRQGHYQQALQALTKALHAPARPDRPVADQGRRKDIQALIAKIHADS